MKVGQGNVVTLSYDICNAEGEIIETSDISGPVTFLCGTGSIIPGLDRRIEGLEAGAEATFEIPPEEAFGRTADAPTSEIPRKEFPDGAAPAVDSVFEAGLPNGGSVRLLVVAVDDANVTVKMLHPLADQTIGMTVKVVALRPATQAELAAGRALTAPPKPPPTKA